MSGSMQRTSLRITKKHMTIAEILPAKSKNLTKTTSHQPSNISFKFASLSSFSPINAVMNGT